MTLKRACARAGSEDLSVIQNLRPKIRFLTREIGIAPHCVRKVIVSFPQILGLSIDDNLRPTARYLLDDVGIPQDRLNKTIVTRPQILACRCQAPDTHARTSARMHGACTPTQRDRDRWVCGGRSSGRSSGGLWRRC